MPLVKRYVGKEKISAGNMSLFVNWGVCVRWLLQESFPYFRQNTWIGCIHHKTSKFSLANEAQILYRSALYFLAKIPLHAARWMRASKRQTMYF